MSDTEEDLLFITLVEQCQAVHPNVDCWMSEGYVNLYLEGKLIEETQEENK